MSPARPTRQKRSAALFARALRVIPGGVNSPVRAFGAVGGHPPFIARAQGAYCFDADGQRYLDFVGSWGPLILGHAHAGVVEAVTRAARDGLSFGAPTARETELAELILSALPSLEQLRLTCSGTEAVMSAIRLARGATGRDLIIKFAGGYHGHSDSLLMSAGSGVATFGRVDSAGVPQSLARETLVLPYNDANALEAAFKKFGARIACVIIEPIAGNMNFVRADVDFLRQMRLLCRRSGALLIFDEVMSGFRVAWGGAQNLLGIRPDLTVLGKVIGGGLPLAAFGGPRRLMRHLAPQGGVYQAGTLSGNPLATAAGLATLKELRKRGFYERLGRMTRAWVNGLQNAASEVGVPLSADSEGGLFGFFLLPNLPRNYAQASAAPRARFAQFHRAMLAEGIYLAPSAMEAGFVSAAHTQSDIAHALQCASRALQSLQKSRH